MWHLKHKQPSYSIRHPNCQSTRHNQSQMKKESAFLEQSQPTSQSTTQPALETGCRCSSYRESAWRGGGGQRSGTQSRTYQSSYQQSGHKPNMISNQVMKQPSSLETNQSANQKALKHGTWSTPQHAVDHPVSQSAKHIQSRAKPVN